jgi:hypothetical protein
MVKNLFLLGLLTWVTLSYAKEPAVARESIGDAEAYRVEKPAQEQEATRGVAGSKIKRKKQSEVKGDGAEKAEPTEADSEVRYWQYSE